MYWTPQIFQLEWKPTLEPFDPKKKKSYIAGDSDLNRICKNKFKEITPNARVYVKCFSGANTNQLDYYVVPVLLYEKPDNVIIYIGSNEITKFNYNNVDAEELSNEFINTELKCRTNGLSNAAVSFILKRNSFNMNQVIYQLNRILKRFFSINDFFYLCNDEVNENYLWKDGLDLIYEGSSLLLNNVINYFNRKGINSVWLMTKGCDIEENIDIKQNSFEVAEEGCSISQKLISNSNSSSKSNT